MGRHLAGTAFVCTHEIKNPTEGLANHNDPARWMRTVEELQKRLIQQQWVCTLFVVLSHKTHMRHPNVEQTHKRHRTKSDTKRKEKREQCD